MVLQEGQKLGLNVPSSMCTKDNVKIATLKIINMNREKNRLLCVYK